MKRICVFLVMMFATVCVFAQNYSVQSVKGRVQQEKGGSRVDLKVGDALTTETIVYTGIGASLVLKEGDNTFTITAARSGKVADLTLATSSVRISGNVSKTDTSVVNRTTGRASTASARASEAAQDEDIAAE